jgi:hypothetical protein
MMSKRPSVVAAADAFASVSNPDDALFTMNFNETSWLGLPENMPFSSDRSRIHDALLGLRARGRTALYDGLSAALDHLVLSPLDRHVLILVSDGGDNASQMALRDILEKVRGARAEIYVVGLFDEFSGGDKKALKALASASGGVAFFPRATREARATLERIAKEIRSSSSRIMRPTPAGRLRKVRVVFSTSQRATLTVRVGRRGSLPVWPPRGPFGEPESIASISPAIASDFPVPNSTPQAPLPVTLRLRIGTHLAGIPSRTG